MKKATRKAPRQADAVEVDPRFAPIVDAFANDRHVSGKYAAFGKGNDSEQVDCCWRRRYLG